MSILCLRLFIFKKCQYCDSGFSFLKSVNIGDLLFFHSQIVFTHENKVQTRVSAEILDKESYKLKLTNVLQLTFELPSAVPSVIPMSYHEAMAYLTGRRHFILGLEREGILEEGMAQKMAVEVSLVSTGGISALV